MIRLETAKDTTFPIKYKVFYNKITIVPEKIFIYENVKNDIESSNF